MATIVRSCPYCGNPARLPAPPPAWDGPKPCPSCGQSLALCTARGEPFFFHLFRMPEEGDALHVCRAHGKASGVPEAA
jgi:hypothetical protein